MTKVLPIWLLATVLLTPVPAQAQPAGKIARIGFLSGSGTPSNPAMNERAFRQGLGELGYVEGKSMLLEVLYAQGKRERIPALVAELVQLRVDLIATGNMTAIRAAMKATQTTPIVMVTNADPVATKLIDSLARPGGNVTGLTNLNRDLNAKRLELLQEIIPKLSRVAVLWDPTNEGSAIGLREYEAAARAMKIQLNALELRGTNANLNSLFEAAIRSRADAILPIRSAVTLVYLTQIVDLAKKHRMASIADGRDFAEAGALVSYGSNNADLFRRAAVLADKILKGAKPADLPVEQPTKFDFVINLKTAKQIGVTIPQSVLYRADRVIR